MRSSIRTATSALRLIALLLLPVSAMAATGDADRARAAFQDGKQEYDLGHFEKALARYDEAYRLDPRPAILFNIAQCHRLLGNYERAAFFYRRFLALGDPRGEAKTLAESLLREVELKQAEVESARKAEREARRLRDLEQARAAAARAEAEEARKKKAQTAPTKDAPLRLQGPATDAAAPVALNEGAPKPAVDSGGITKKWWFWTAVGVAAAGVGTGVWFATAPQPVPTTLGTRNLR